MPDFRAYHPALASGPELTLSSEESHHLVAVNRARAGDAVIVFDGRGQEWTCELVSDRKQGAVLRIHSSRQVPRLPFELTLAQALPKGPAMDAIVRKATELGAVRIVPLETERTQVHFEGERSDRKLEKWQTAAVEAAKQCGNPFVPDITPVKTLAQFLADLATYDFKLIASLHPGARSLKVTLADFRARETRAPRNAVWLIGPEGDFSPAEIAAALQQGFVPITLGPLVLRSDTAATVAVGILSYELQNAE